MKKRIYGIILGLLVLFSFTTQAYGIAGGGGANYEDGNNTYRGRADDDYYYRRDRYYDRDYYYGRDRYYGRRHSYFTSGLFDILEYVFFYRNSSHCFSPSASFKKPELHGQNDES